VWKLLPAFGAAQLLLSCQAQSTAEQAGEDNRVECALAGAPAFERVCTVERNEGAEGLTLTIRAPDGGFRRLLVTNDGRGVIPADGAIPAIVTVVSDVEIEVAIADERYRLPATIGAAPRPSP
jgi:hypothetical protein